MLIEVKVAGWEQHCCGEAFVVGGTGTWNVIAEDSAQAVHLPTFHTEQHGQAEPGVPNWDVTGIITRIDGLFGQHAPVPGQPKTSVWADDRTKLHPLEAVSARGEDDEHGYDTYLVTLEVPDDTVLPDYAESEFDLRHREAEAARRERSRAAMTDGVGLELEALADQAQTLFASVADILRDPHSSAISFRARAPQTAEVHWARLDDDGSDVIEVKVADGSWTIGASPASVAELHDVLEATAAGRVEEEFEGPPDLRLTTTLHFPDGRVRSHSQTFALPPVSEFQWVAGPEPLMSRMASGARTYVAWS
jgi:hypothetical protein